MKELAGLMIYLAGIMMSFIGFIASKSKSCSFVWCVSLITQFVILFIYYLENF